jgi:hypothetical protein
MHSNGTERKGADSTFGRSIWRKISERNSQLAVSRLQAFLNGVVLWNRVLFNV